MKTVRLTKKDTPKARVLHVAFTAKSTALALLVCLGAWVAIKLAPVALVVIVALFLVGTLNPAVVWLEARKVKRGHGIMIVFTLTITFILGVAAIAIPALIGQVVELIHKEPEIRQKLVDLLSRSRATTALAESLSNLDYGVLIRGAGAIALKYSARSIEIMAYLVSSLFLALYVLIDRDRLRGGLYAMVARRHHVRLSRVIINLEVIVGGYIRGQLLTSGLMAAFTFVLLLACQVKSALTLAVIAGIADVLPYIGAFLSVGPAVAAASSRGIAVVVIVLAAMLIYQEIESRFLVPRIYGNVLKLPSSIVLVALLAGGTLGGITGALLALPVAAAVRMLSEELRVELPGEDVDDAVERAQDILEELEYERRAHGVPAEAAAAIAVEISQERSDLIKPG